MYRANVVHCPRCRTDGLDGPPLQTCRTCGGQWIAEELLTERVARMRDTTHGTVAWTTDESRPALPCASCDQPMSPLRYDAIAVDHCRTHGLWFDRHELAALLLASGTASAALTATAVAATEMPPSERTADLGSSTAEVVVGSLDGVGVVAEVLEFLGGVLGAIADL